MKTNTNDQDVKNANAAVEKAYTAIIKEVKDLLTKFPTEELRTFVTREGTSNDSKSFYSPMIYISVRNNYGKRYISFAKNLNVKMHIGIEMDSQLVRVIYRQTAIDVTKINIEDRIEQYPFTQNRMLEALKQTETDANYKRDIVHPVAA